MTLKEWQKQKIAWFENKSALSDYGMLWITFFKGIFLALVVED